MLEGHGTRRTLAGISAINGRHHRHIDIGRSEILRFIDTIARSTIGHEVVVHKVIDRGQGHSLFTIVQRTNLIVLILAATTHFLIDLLEPSIIEVLVALTKDRFPFKWVKKHEGIIVTLHVTVDGFTWIQLVWICVIPLITIIRAFKGHIES